MKAQLRFKLHFLRSKASKPAEYSLRTMAGNCFQELANKMQGLSSNHRHLNHYVIMSLTSRNARPAFFAGAVAFAVGIWPTLYSPLGVDKAGNPMRENRLTGAEEVRPAGSSEWVDAAKYLELTRTAQGNDSILLASQR